MRLATDPNPKKKRSQGKIENFIVSGQININIPLQSSSFDVIHINVCSFRPIRNVHMLI